MMTSIKLPVSKRTTRDADGNRHDEYVWSESIPATVRDCTDKESIEAMQLGYNSEQIYEVDIAAYNIAHYMIDESNGCIYDISRAVRNSGSRIVSIYAQRRKSGDGVNEVN